MKNNTHSNIKKAIEALQQGKTIIITDDSNRENEGDLVAAASSITEFQLNQMLKHGSGIICLSMTEKNCKRLDLKPMVNDDENNSSFNTPFTVAVDAKRGISSGVSVADRLQTIKVICEPQSSAADLSKPGHLYPLRANKHGVLGRRGHTEGSLDLVTLAGMPPYAVICEAMNANGYMLRGEALDKFATDNNLLKVSIQEIVDYKLQHSNLIINSASSILPTKYGEFEVYAAEDIYGKQHLMLYKKYQTKTCPVRIHSSCITGDALGSLRCDCGTQLNLAMQQLSETGGALIYLAQEGRGIGLVEKIKAYKLQDKGMDTVDANLHLGHKIDNRNYAIAAQMLRQKNLTEINLLTNNPQKILQIEKYGINVASRQPLLGASNKFNCKYLQTKKNKMGHLLEQV